MLTSFGIQGFEIVVTDDLLQYIIILLGDLFVTSPVLSDHTRDLLVSSYTSALSLEHFLLTLGALISLLVGGLAGVTGNRENLYMFRVNTTGLEVKPTDLRGLVGARDAAAEVAAAAEQEEARRAAEGGKGRCGVAV